MNIPRFFRVLLPLFLVIGLYSCDKEDEEITLPDTPETTYLVSYQKLGSMNPKEIKTTILKIVPDIDTTQLTYDVDYYKIIYRATYLNRSVNLSGLVLMPSGFSGKLRQVQYHHGSYRAYPSNPDDGDDPTNAPSLYDNSKVVRKNDFAETRGIGFNMASRGNFVSMPDYSGYGGTYDSLVHLCMCTPEVAQESYAMMMAARELARAKSLSLTTDIVLCGWSEGAAVSLYLQKIVEAKKKLTVSLNSCLAGPYVLGDYLPYLNKMSEDEENKAVFLFGWIVLSYCMVNDVPPSNFFNASITDMKSLIYADTHQSLTLKTLFNEKTRAGKYENVEELVSSGNAAKGWVPQGSVHLFQGLMDDMVPFTQMAAATKEFSQSSTPNGRITTHTEFFGNHFNFVDKFVAETINLMKGL